MNKLVIIAFLAFLMLMASSALVLADDEEDKESDGQNEAKEN